MVSIFGSDRLRGAFRAHSWIALRLLEILLRSLLPAGFAGFAV